MRNGDRLKNEREPKMETDFKVREGEWEVYRSKDERESEMETDVKEREYGRETDKESGGRARVRDGDRVKEGGSA